MLPHFLLSTESFTVNLLFWALSLSPAICFLEETLEYTRGEAGFYLPAGQYVTMHFIEERKEKVQWSKIISQG